MCTVDGGSQCSEKSPNRQETLEKQNGLIGRTGLLGPNQLFPWTSPGTFCDSIIASPGKGKAPQPFTKVLHTIHITDKSNEPQDLEGSRIIPSWGSRYVSTRRLQWECSPIFTFEICVVCLPCQCLVFTLLLHEKDLE